jgi:hypothetical protein
MEGWENAAIAFVAFGGGIVYAFYFWLTSGEKFDGKKFGASVIAAMFAGAVFGIGYTFIDKINGVDLLTAFVSGTGITAAGSKVIGPKTTAT